MAPSVFTLDLIDRADGCTRSGWVMLGETRFQ